MTELRTEQSALELICDTSAQFEALLDAAVDAIIIIDEHGIVSTFNKAAEQMFGYAEREIVGRNISMLMPEPYSTHHNEYLNNYMQTGEAKIIGIGREVFGRRKSGEVFPIELSVGEARTSRAHCFVGIVRDASHRKETEERLRQTGERLAYLGRVNTLGEMSAGIAHEINQPLAAIGAYSQACRRLMAELEDVPPEVRTALNRIESESHRAGQVIHRLRALARQTTVYRRPTDCNAMLREACALAALDVKSHDLELVTEFAENLPRIYADAIQIQQIVLNLIRNAIDAMKVIKPKDSRIIVRTRQTGDTVTISVTDHGCGISPEAAERLFDPFFTTKPSGMGVGLSISRSIMEAHGGTLSFEPNPKGGTVFRAVIPMAEEQA